MSGAVVFEERICVPFVNNLGEFRTWLHSDDFPDKGRIDYIAGQIEVDMSPEDLFSHGSIKTRVASVIDSRVFALQSGAVFVDSTRVTCPTAELSVEPDIVYLSHESVDAGRVKLVPGASEVPDRYVEIEGPPDLVVEIISDSSVGKDTKRLPQKYFAAGVQELWLLDAPKEVLSFTIFVRGENSYIAATPDDQGFSRSNVLDAKYSLERRRDRKGWPSFVLHERAK